MEAFYCEHGAELEKTMATRREWEHSTERARRLALAADAEFRRRHPGQQLEPLRSAEPRVTEDDRGQLALTPGAETHETPEWITQLAAERRAVAERLDERKTILVPSEDPDHGPELFAWPTRSEHGRDAILQPPKPEMRPSPAVLQRVASLEAEPS
jgi:hypothetical protein